MKQRWSGKIVTNASPSFNLKSIKTIFCKCIKITAQSVIILKILKNKRKSFMIEQKLTCFWQSFRVCWSSAMNFREWDGTTRSSWSPVSSNTAGYWVSPSGTLMLWRGEYLKVKRIITVINLQTFTVNCCGEAFLGPKGDTWTIL